MAPTRPARSTARRWAKEGIDGVVLETVRLGGRRYTSHEAVARFFERLNAGPEYKTDHAQGPAQPDVPARGELTTPGPAA